MKLALTGARGRLAPCLAQFFTELGHSVDLYSRTPGSGLRPLDSFPADHQPDAVIHCAWSTVPKTAEESPTLHRETDLPLLHHLLKASPSSLFVFLSTGAVYGNTGSYPADETRKPAPLGAYAQGKWEAEQLIFSVAPSRSLVLRIGNLLGENKEPARPQGILLKLLEAARTGVPVEIWGDGLSLKDYLHCSDFCEALGLLLEHEEKGIFNVGSGVTHSVLELIECVEKITGLKIPRIHRPGFPWDVRDGRLDCRKLMQTVGWRPKVTLEEAIRRSLDQCLLIH